MFDVFEGIDGPPDEAAADAAAAESVFKGLEMVVIYKIKSMHSAECFKDYLFKLCSVQCIEFFSSGGRNI